MLKNKAGYGLSMFATLLPGETREISIAVPGDAATLQGASGRLRGWYVEPALLVFSGDAMT